MKLLIVQKDIKNTDYVGILRQAAASSPDLVALGELCTSGCLYRPRRVTDLATICKALSEFPFDISLGLPRKTKKGLYNSYLYRSANSYQIYDKINLFSPMNEDRIYVPGTKAGLFDTQFGTIGVAICFDLRFPDIFRNLKKLGATMIFVPAAFPRVRITDWKELLVERARVNDVIVVAINAVGDDGVNEFGGSSMVVDTDGEIVVQADETSETILEVHVDQGKVTVDHIN